MPTAVGIVIGHDRVTGEPIVLTDEARKLHVYVTGATGSGKSRLIEAIVRADVLKWSSTRAGMLVLDPHGSLYDNIVGWMAQLGVRRVPVVPFDLRRVDRVLTYNPVRARPGERTRDHVIAANFAEAIGHAWGVSDLNATPRLKKWTTTLLMTLLSNRLTVAEILLLIRSPDLRQQMAANVTDEFAKTVWETSRAMSEAEFHEATESVVNRMSSLLSAEVLIAALGQTGPSLDFAKAIERGAMVLACLSPTGGQVHGGDARTVGALMLADLWSTAEAKGTSSRRFTAILDEFQSYVSPVIADTLAESRKFNLHFILSHQFPSQLVHQGPAGAAVLDAVQGTARTRIAFAVDHEADLLMLTNSICRNEITLDRVKHRSESVRVVGHELTYLPSYSTSEANGESRGTSATRTIGESSGRHASRSITDGTSEGTSVSSSRGTSRSDGRTTTHGTSSGVTDGATTSSSVDAGESITLHRDFEAPRPGLKRHVREEEIEYDDLLVTTDEETGEDDPAKVRRLERATQKVEVSRARSHGEGSGNAFSRQTSSGRSDSDAVTESSGTSTTDGKSLDYSTSHSRSDSEGVDQSRSRSESEGRSRQVNRTRTQGRSESPMLIPVYGVEQGTPVFYSIDEQRFALSQELSAQQRQEFTVRLYGESGARRGRTAPVPDPVVRPARREAWLAEAFAKLDFALPLDEALRRVAERHATLARAGTSEPTETKRRRPKA
jgi:hypothetical protein